jgi:8-oxo-dGTP pyrophosphatase MutT (NUDIX family)
MRTSIQAIGATALTLVVAGCAADKAHSNATGMQAADDPQAASSCRHDYLAAGILPYTIRNGRVVVLLGEESRTEGLVWTDFIGTRKDPDCEPVVTAAREFCEETRDAYPEAATVEYIRERRPLIIDPPGVYFWIMPVDYVTAENLRNGPGGRWSEKFTYCWVDLAGLLRAVDEDARRIPAACGGRSERLFTKFENNLRKGGPSRDALEELLARHTGT